MWRDCVCLMSERESGVGGVTIVVARSADVTISSGGTRRLAGEW